MRETKHNCGGGGEGRKTRAPRRTCGAHARHDAAGRRALRKTTRTQDTGHRTHRLKQIMDGHCTALGHTWDMSVRETAAARLAHGARTRSEQKRNDHRTSGCRGGARWPRANDTRLNRTNEKPQTNRRASSNQWKRGCERDGRRGDVRRAAPKTRRRGSSWPSRRRASRRAACRRSSSSTACRRSRR